MIFDCTVFFQEKDLLEIRLHELNEVADQVIILEASETYGGDRRSLLGQEALEEIKSRHPHLFRGGRIKYYSTPAVLPKMPSNISTAQRRELGRARERNQRDQLFPMLRLFNPSPDDIIVFSDLDEIPTASSVLDYFQRALQGIWRLKQHSYYYNVNTLTDYGHDWASRARVGRYEDLLRVGSMYEFRMANKNTDQQVMENGGWHFSYFGGVEAIRTKVAALSSFLVEYRLFGDTALQQDIKVGKDLHHRKCEMPDRFQKIPTNQIPLPTYLVENLDRFAHFVEEGY